MDIIFIMKKSADAGVYAGKESGTESAGTGNWLQYDAVKTFRKIIQKKHTEESRKQKTKLLFFLMRQQPVLYWLY